MWERDEDRIALLELLAAGRLRRRTGQGEAWTVLAEVPWTRRTSRRDEIELVAEHRGTVVELLDRVWPDWRLAVDALAARGLDPTPTGWRRLQDRLRAEDVATLPQRLNRRTAASAVAPHSKSTLSSSRRSALGTTQLTRDGIVRLRPPDGLHFSRSDVRLAATQIAGVLGEVAVTERALIDGTVLHGEVTAVLLVENLGPYQDLQPPDGWLTAHVPGWDTATVRLFLDQLRDVPLVHFGDLDPNGVRIVRHLRHIRSDLLWAVPEFWSECVAKRALPGDWPADLDLSDTPALVRNLAQRRLWLEQETIAVDGRLPAALQDVLRARITRAADQEPSTSRNASP